MLNDDKWFRFGVCWKNLPLSFKNYAFLKILKNKYIASGNPLNKINPSKKEMASEGAARIWKCFSIGRLYFNNLGNYRFHLSGVFVNAGRFSRHTEIVIKTHLFIYMFVPQTL